jgi:hypothetical protein
MQRAHRLTFLVLGISLLLGFSLLFGPGVENRAQAQSISTSSGLRISSSVIGNGGGVSSGGVYRVSGTIGQPLGQVSSNGGFVLRSGFWHMPLEQYVFLPMIRR